MGDEEERGAGGGSSRIFSSALAAWGVISSAASTMATRRPPSAAVSWKKPVSARISSTVMAVLQALGLVVPGAAAEEELRRGERGELAEDRVVGGHVEGRGGAARDEEAGDAPGERRLADARRAGERQAWARRPVAAASRKRASAASWPKRTAVSRGCGAPGRRSGSGMSVIGRRARRRGRRPRPVRRWPGRRGSGRGTRRRARGSRRGAAAGSRGRGARSGPRRRRGRGRGRGRGPRAQVEDHREVGLEADGERVQRVDHGAQAGAGDALVDAGRNRRSGRRSPWRRGRARGGWCARGGRGGRR